MCPLPPVTYDSWKWNSVFTKGAARILATNTFAVHRAEALEGLITIRSFPTPWIWELSN